MNRLAHAVSVDQRADEWTGLNDATETEPDRRRYQIADAETGDRQQPQRRLKTLQAARRAAARTVHRQRLAETDFVSHRTTCGSR